MAFLQKINNFSEESDTINLFNKMKYLVNTLVDIETNLIKESKDELQRQQYEVRIDILRGLIEIYTSDIDESSESEFEYYPELNEPTFNY